MGVHTNYCNYFNHESSSHQTNEFYKDVKLLNKIELIRSNAVSRATSPPI